MFNISVDAIVYITLQGMESSNLFTMRTWFTDLPQSEYTFTVDNSSLTSVGTYTAGLLLPFPDTSGDHTVTLLAASPAGLFQINSTTGGVILVDSTAIVPVGLYHLSIVIHTVDHLCLTAYPTITILVIATSGTTTATPTSAPTSSSMPLTTTPTASASTNIPTGIPSLSPTTPGPTAYIPTVYICPEQDLGECEVGACLSSPQGTNCLCSAGYGGNTCSTPVCDLVPCFNNGTCVPLQSDLVLGYECTCALGLVAPQCGPPALVFDTVNFNVSDGTPNNTLIGTVTTKPMSNMPAGLINI